MLRRNFLRLLASGVLFAFFAARARGNFELDRYAFNHGVASGDPLVDGVILWTRVSGGSGETVSVIWQVASDPDMRSLLSAGRTETDASRDYTVKVDVRKLPAGSRLYYRFTVGDIDSPIGKSRTLPAGSIDLARFAVVSCSNYPAGYFHAYGEIARRDDLDAVIHLGDYIYEYGLGEYATHRAEELDRVPDPPTETITLDDYRRRYAQYRSDPDSQAMHAAHPLIAVWDDHEVANDSWKKGADNHNRDAEFDEGRWSQRRDAAFQAYFEWLPIRGKPKGRRTRLFREFNYGNLLSLVLLDTRYYGRDRQPDISETDGTRTGIEAVLHERKRRMLGWRQQRWLRKKLDSTVATWQVIAQQVLVSPLNSPDLEPVLDPDKPALLSRERVEVNIAMSKTNPALLLDTWDGYPWARQKLLQDIDGRAANAVLLSGDLHTAIAGNLVPDGRDRPVAVEFMAPSVSSPGFAEYLPERRPGAIRDATLQQNPNLRYMETDRRGWLCMTLTHTECRGEWHLLNTVTEINYESSVDRRLAVGAGNIAAGLYDI